MARENDVAEYLTKCSSKNDGSVIYEHIYDAGSIDEAINKAFTGCVKQGNKVEDITVNVNRIFFSL
jgi:hypothetical protein